MDGLKKNSIIVVSDVHLGHERSNFIQFNDFLDWIQSKKNQKQENKLLVKFNGIRKRILVPEMIIFLGDILELWEPKKDDVGFVGRRSKKFIEKIIELPCEKIYVLGNHDKTFEELRAQAYELTSGNLQIFYRNFPKKAESEYLTIGKSTYFFIHGHQFDKDMRYFGSLAEVGPSILLSLQRTNKKVFKLKGFGSLAISLFLWILDYLFPLWIFENSVPYIITFLSPFWSANLLWIAGRFFTRYFFKARYKDIKSVIKKGWYDTDKDTVIAENLVFAHTHYPGIEKAQKLIPSAKKKLFINCGSWFEKEKYPNTFLYIDEKEILLIEWKKNVPKVLIIYDIETEEISYSDEMKQYIQKPKSKFFKV